MSKTEDNLKAAFDGEAKACLRLLGYAEAAEKEEMPYFAGLFRAISAAERVHALNHLRLMKEIEDTQTNLQKSFERETSVTDNVYPEMIKTADEEGNKGALTSFSHARDAESYHAKLYKNALDHMIAEKVTHYNVCGVCGYVVDGDAPDECPVCGAKKEHFFRVD